MTAARLPRHRRVENPPPMQLTERDLQVIRMVSDYRHCTREQIQLVLFTSTTASYCKRRLMLLFQHAYLKRQFLPLRAAFGAARPYYELDKRGADLLSEVMEIPRSQLDWRPRDGRREALYMEHTLKSNDVRALIQVAARDADLAFQWTDERELKRRSKDFRVPDPQHPDELITIIPDGHILLGQRWTFAVELDRGTVEEHPFRRKIRGYTEWRRSGRYAQSFETQSLRVLFVVTDARRDPARLDRIQKWTEQAGGGNLFWFANLIDLTSAGLLAAPLWHVAGSPEKRAMVRSE